MREGKWPGPAHEAAARPRPPKAARDGGDRAAWCPHRRPRRGASGRAGTRCPSTQGSCPLSPHACHPATCLPRGTLRTEGTEGSLCPSAHGRLPRSPSSPQRCPDRRLGVHQALHLSVSKDAPAARPARASPPLGTCAPRQRPSSWSLEPRPWRRPPPPGRRRREEEAVVHPPTGRPSTGHTPVVSQVRVLSREVPCEDKSPDFHCGWGPGAWLRVPWDPQGPDPRPEGTARWWQSRLTPNASAGGKTKP